MYSQDFSTKHIEYAEKGFLDGLTKINANTLNIKDIGDTRLLKVKGISNFWDYREEKASSVRIFMEDVVSGFYEAGVPLIFGVFSKVDKVDILIGTCSIGPRSAEENLQIVRNSIRSSFQGIEFQELTPDYLKKNIESFQFTGLVTGTPTGKSSQEGIWGEQIERAIRGFYGRECGYLVVAEPAKSNEINTSYNSVLNEIRLIDESNRRAGVENPIGGRYKKVLEYYLEILQTAKIQGMWHTTIYLLAKNQETLNNVKAVMKSAFGGSRSLPDRIRTFDIEGKITNVGPILNPPTASPGRFTYTYSLMTTLNSGDLAIFVQFPTQDVRGFQLKPYAQFGVSVQEKEGEKIEIGEILDQGNKIGVSYAISPNALKKHSLVVGTTGSGKTNTIFRLLREAWKRKIPFTVIEPAKNEYRSLLLNEEIGNDLSVFTLGDNNVSPFRINPFEIMPGVSVQTHIDLLKSVFNASFYMWGILPQVLERCIHEVYSDKGWDLVSGKNQRGTHKNANPTLTDLYNKIDQVVDRLGYSKDTDMELRSALKTRINSLRIGGKGLMLDTKKSISFKSLMSKPTVLELQAVGDDEEKSFLMGLVLAMMYEYYVSSGISVDTGIAHITVIEEAHRLLANYSDNPYGGNVRGKAVETFTNILSEIRAYGEGFLIAEQIPTKLASDVIKNTNLKVMHRIVAEDDRRVMGATMNIEERETKKIASLNPLEAAIYGEGDICAYHVKVDWSKISDKENTGNKDEIVTKAMENFKKQQEFFAPFDACAKHCKSICTYKNLGEEISSQKRFYSQISPLILSLIDNANYVAPTLRQMLETGREKTTNTADKKGAALCSFIQASERYFEQIGSYYRWPYTAVEKLKEFLYEFYTDAADKFYLSETDSSSEALNQTKILDFKNFYRSLCEQKQPTRFCERICPDGLCLYRPNLSEILKDNSYTSKFNALVDEAPEDNFRRSEKIDTLCREAAKEALPDGSDDVTRKIALCTALQKSMDLPPSKRQIDLVMDSLIEYTQLSENE